MKFLWDMNIQYDIIEVKRPDIVLVEKKEKRCLIIDIAVPVNVPCSERKLRK